MWHPGGAHPFVGLNEALVHNGDFANYHSVCEYLRQRNIKQQFLTDTEVSVQLFDLWDRVYKYPLEYIIEALAPTAERIRSAAREKQRIYRQIQATHIHASPDGPWFFIIARNHPDQNACSSSASPTPRCCGRRCSRWPTAATCRSASSARRSRPSTPPCASLAREDPRFCPVADQYWNARGGS